MNKKERNNSLDAVKGFTILIVMLGHVIVLNGLNDPILYDWIKAVQMPLFMMVSGYLCGISHKVQNAGDYGRMIGKRLISYILPFFMWTLVFHLDDFTWAIPAYFEQPERGLWFLITLFILTVMVYTAQLARAWAGKKSAAAGFIGFWFVYAVLTGLVFVQAAAGIPWFGPHLTKIYIPFYMAAYVYGEYEQKIRAVVSGRIHYAAAAAGGVFCLVIVCTRDLMVMNGFADYVLQNLASLGGCMAVIAAFYRMKEGRVKRFLAWLGMYTLEIYSIHYHFARLLNNGSLQIPCYSPQWFGFIAAGFVLMAVLTALVVVAAKQFSVTNYLLYGKKDTWRGLKERKQ